MHKYSRGSRAALFSLSALLFCALILTASHATAGLLDAVKNQVLSGSSTGTPASQSSLSDGEVIKGLKEALHTTVNNSVSYLGKSGGFLNTPSVRIPLPDSLKTAEQVARSLGQGELADNFIATMNSAAEQATSETASIFYDSISKMSFEDARAILNGPKDAATGYFRRTSTDDLVTRIRPIVEKATESVHVTESYKKFTAKMKVLSPLMEPKAADLDGYVTDKTVQGIFTIMAQEEARIRTDPVARTTDLLKKVFGATGK